jgi:hypothetical protein
MDRKEVGIHSFAFVVDMAWPIKRSLGASNLTRHQPTFADAADGSPYQH